MSENWSVISFWVRLWAFCWFVTAKFIGTMLGKLVREIPYALFWKRH